MLLHVKNGYRKRDLAKERWRGEVIDIYVDGGREDRKGERMCKKEGEERKRERDLAREIWRGGVMDKEGVGDREERKEEYTEIKMDERERERERERGG